MENKFQTLPVLESCAFSGAVAVASNIRKCLAAMHSGPGCGFSMSFGCFICSGQQSGSYWSGMVIPSTTLVERDIIFGGEESLYKLLTGPWQDMLKEPELIFVCTGCIGDVIGDDIERVIERATPKLKRTKAIYAITGGFKGTATDGANLALDAICRRLVQPPKVKRKNTVNIFGITPYIDPYWWGDILEIKRMMNALGIKVNAVVPGDCDRKSLERLAEASLNVVVSDKVGIPPAEYLKENYEMPYVFAKRGAPIGIEATNEFLMEVAENLSLDLRKVKKKLDEEAAYVCQRFDQAIPSWVNRSSDTYALIASSHYALGTFRFLTHELGFYPVLIALTLRGKTSEEVLKGLVDELLPPERQPLIMLDPTSHEIKQTLLQMSPPPAFLLGRTVEKYLSPQIRSTHFSITWPVYDRVILDKGYMGYKGAINFFEDLLTAVGAWTG